MTDVKRWNQVSVFDAIGAQFWSGLHLQQVISAAIESVPEQYRDAIEVDMTVEYEPLMTLPRLTMYYHRELTPEEVAAFDALGE